MPDPVNLIQIEKPELGRASDNRLTQEYIDARPELAGFPAFVPGVDVDLVGQINDRMASLHALVKYASPELAAGLIGVLGDLGELSTELADLKTDIEQSRAQLLANGSLTPAPTEAALIGKPAGGYRIVATNEAVVWSGSVVTARGPAAPTLLDVPGRTSALAALAGIRPGAAVAGITAAMQAQTAANRNRLDFEAGEYTLSETLSITAHSAHLRGQGGSDWVGNGATPAGTILRASASVPNIVTLTGAANGVVGAYSVEGFTFAGTNRTQTGIRSTMGNGPARPFNVQHATFTGLDSGVRSDVPAGWATGLFCANLIGITARENNYGLYGTGQGSWGCLNVLGSVIEQNVKGGLVIEPHAQGGLFGPSFITGNLLEGQKDPIILNGGLVANFIGPNYFEVNTGKLRLAATNGSSTHTVMPQYTHNSPELYGEVAGGHAYIWDKTIPWRPSYSANVRVYEADRMAVAPTATPAPTFLTFSPSVLRNRVPPPLGHAVIGYSTGTVMDTPSGRQKCLTIPANGNSGWLSPNVTTQAGEALVAVALARRGNPDTPVSMGPGWYDNAYSDIGTSPQVMTVPSGEWVVLLTVLTGAPTGTKPRFRWLTDAAAIIGETTFYRAALPAPTATAAQLAAAAVPLFLATPAPIVDAPATGPVTRSDVAGIAGIGASGYERWGLSNPNARYVSTPTGPRRVALIAAGGNTGGIYLNTRVAQTASQLLRATFYARVLGGGAATLTVSTVNGSGGNLAAGVTLQISGSELTLYGVDLPVQAEYLGNVNGTTTRYRVSSNAEAEVSDAGSYAYDPATLTTPPLFAPRTGEVMVPVTIPAGQTSVTVPHRQPFAPGVALAQAGAGVAAWISPLADLTNIIVNIAAAQSSDTTVYAQLSG